MSDRIEIYVYWIYVIRHSKRRTPVVKWQILCVGIRLETGWKTLVTPMGYVLLRLVLIVCLFEMNIVVMMGKQLGLCLCVCVCVCLLKYIYL